MCPKNVEQAIRSAIKIHLLHLVGIFISTQNSTFRRNRNSTALCKNPPPSPPHPTPTLLLPLSHILCQMNPALTSLTPQFFYTKFNISFPSRLMSFKLSLTLRLYMERVFFSKPKFQYPRNGRQAGGHTENVYRSLM
jgi:hypothetical protein